MTSKETFDILMEIKDLELGIRQQEIEMEKRIIELTKWVRHCEEQGKMITLEEWKKITGRD